MKKYLFSFLLFALLGCGSSYQEKGTLKLTNGEKQETEVPYSVSAYEEFSKAVTAEDFYKIAETASSEAKSRCKFPPTYVPVRMNFFQTNDTTVANVIFTAKNAFGVSDELTTYSTFQGTRLIKTL